MEFVTIKDTEYFYLDFFPPRPRFRSSHITTGIWNVKKWSTSHKMGEYQHSHPWIVSSSQKTGGKSLLECNRQEIRASHMKVCNRSSTSPFITQQCPYPEQTSSFFLQTGRPWNQGHKKNVKSMVFCIPRAISSLMEVNLLHTLFNLFWLWHLIATIHILLPE